MVSTLLTLILVAVRVAAAADDDDSPVTTILRAVDDGDKASTLQLLHSGQVENPVMIHTCAQKGFSGAGRLLLDNGARVDEQFEHFGTPLHTSASNGQKQMTKLLLSRGAIVDAANSGGLRPLHLAAQHGHTAVVRLLLENRANVNEPTGSPTPSPIHFAAMENHVKTIRVLLKHGADVNALFTKVGWTPLHSAVKEGHAEATRLLLEEGAEVDVTDARGHSALHFAATGTHRGHVSILQLLIAHNASVGLRSSDTSTALHHAAEEDFAAGVAVLAAVGAELEAVTSKGFTPLHRAVPLGRVAAAAALLDAGAHPTPYSHKMLSALHDAADQRKVQAMALLLSRGADPDPRDQSGCTPLAHAAREGFVDVVTALLAGGANCSARDERGLTALHAAAAEGHVEVMRGLMAGCGGEGGVDVATDAGHSPLHAAAFEGHAAAVAELLAQGANVTTTTRAGMTPLDVATRQHSVATRRNHVATRRSQVALRQGQKEHAVVQLLRERGGGEGGAGSDVVHTEERVCGFAGRGVEAVSVAGNGLWPWGVATTTAVGSISVSFSLQRSGLTVVESRSLPLFALPVLRLHPEGGGPSPLSRSHVQAAAVRAGGVLGEGAGRLLAEVKRLRRRLTQRMSVSSRGFWSKHWPMTELIKAVQHAEEGGGGSAEAVLLHSMQRVMEGFVDEVREAAAPMMGCDVEQLHCPDFGQYFRIDPDHYLSYVHLDFPSEAEARFNARHRRTRDDWWNVWVLLSEKPFANPLALLDPGPVGPRDSGFLDPPPAASADGAPSVWRAFTFDGMRQGDVIAWRTTKVPHAGGRLELAEGWGWEDSVGALQQRESVDVRCVCVDAAA